MPEVRQFTLLDAVSVDGTGPAVDVRNITAMSAFVKAVGGTSATVSFEGTADPMGTDGWAAIAMRPPGGGAYAVTGVSVTPSGGKSFFFDPADNVNWIRAKVASNTGPTAVSCVLIGEV